MCSPHPALDLSLLYPGNILCILWSEFGFCLDTANLSLFGCVCVC